MPDLSECEPFAERNVIYSFASAKLLTTYICSPLVMIGLILNAINIAMCYRDRMTKISTRSLSCTMSVINLVLLIVGSLYWQAYARKCRLHLFILPVDDKFLPTAIFILRILNLARSWLCIHVSVERLLYFRPCQIQLIPWWNNRRLCLCIPLILVLATAAHVPQIVWHLCTAANPLVCLPAGAIWVTNMGVEMLFGGIGPMTAHVWLIVLVEVRLRAEFACYSPCDYRAIKGLRMMTSIYLISLMLSMIEKVLFLPVVTGKAVPHRITTLFWGLGEFAQIITASENFVIYFLVSEPFRKAFKDVVGVGDTNSSNDVQLCGCVLFPVRSDNSEAEAPFETALTNGGI